MSNFKKLLIPAIILVVLVGAFLVITNLPEPEEEKTPDNVVETIQIFDFVKDDLTEIQIESQKEQMHFQYVTISVEEDTTNADGTTEKKLVDKRVWQAIVPEGMRVNSSSVDSIAWNANTLKAQKLIEENPVGLADFGLDTPTRLTFIMKDGTRHILLVGNKTPTGGAYYAKKENEPAVYTIGDYEGAKFVQSRFAMMVTELYDKTYAPEDVSAISFTRKGARLFDSTLQEQAKWWLSYPISAEARYENLYTIAGTLAGVFANEYVEDNAADLGKYGLANPAYLFEYTMGGNQYKLSLGSIHPSGGAYYASLNDSGLIFTLTESNFTFLDKPIEEIVGSFIHLQNINDVMEMRITMDGRTDVSKINVDTEDDTKSTYDFNGTVLSGGKDEDDEYISVFKKYYQGAIGLLVDRIVLDVQPALQNPEVVIEYTLKTEEKIKVELVPTPDGVSFYAFKNGQYTGMTLRKKQLEDDYRNGLRVSRPKLADALEQRGK